jgi:hypothetical protein
MMNDLFQTLAGMPGTISADAKRIRWHSRGDSPGGRVYEADVADGLLRAIVSHDEIAPGRKRWHMSVSHRNHDKSRTRVPSWDELKHAFYHLVSEDVPFVLIFPRRSTPKELYVDIHETCLHLWESGEKDVDR